MTYQSLNPFDGELIKTFDELPDAALETKIAIADACFKTWRHKSYAERAAIIVTTNLPFSEWTSVFPNPRLCKALLDRITDRAHMIETGTESFRFRRTMESRKKH